MNETREKMIQTALQLFRRRGYNATSWRGLVDAAGTPWGSAHHHFPGGKEQLGLAALQLGAAGVARQIEALFDAHPAIPDAVRAWCEASAADLARSGFRDGCPIATVALETSPDSAALSKAARAAIDGWRAVIADRLAAAGVRRKRAAELATLVVAGVEGALLVARVSRSTAPLLLAGEHLRALLAAEIG
jgi:TetR/AcrR family transcriptional repressor of lmrAB and yxaGH operons